MRSGPRVSVGQCVSIVGARRAVRGEIMMQVGVERFVSEYYSIGSAKRTGLFRAFIAIHRVFNSA